MEKQLVEVIVKYLTDGKKIPLSIRLKDNECFCEIDKIENIRNCASLKYGGIGQRYTIKVNGHTMYLFCEDDQWFLE